MKAFLGGLQSLEFGGRAEDPVFDQLTANGRHLSAWLGLVPRQHSSGGKSQLRGISKRGEKYLRTLLVRGARSVLRYAVGKTDVQSRWLQDLIARRGYNRAAVALTNKNAMKKLAGPTPWSLILVPASPLGSSRQFAEDGVCGSHRVAAGKFRRADRQAE